MKKCKIVLMMLSLVLVFGTFSTFAFELKLGGNPYFGPMQFQYTNYDYGTLYAPSTVLDHGGAGSGMVDSYGIVRVSVIQGLNPITHNWTNLWSSSATESLEGLFWGLSDDKVNLDANGAGTIYSVGGKIELYLDTTENLDPSAGPQVPGAVGWKPADLYNATDGTLFLSADFVPGIVTGDLTTSYAQQINAITQPISGHGNAYLNITGGSHAAMFNSDEFLGGSADLFLSTEFTGPGPYDWTATSTDPVLGTVVPEPASMLLFGIGMLGFATFKKKVNG